jgi:AcrR family transcriptional regulator
MAENGLERREALMRAAVSVFSRDGFAGASIRAITDAAGCATGTFYLYFPSKEDCFAALIERLYERVLRTVAEARRTATDPAHKLWVSIGAVTRIFADERELAALVLLQAPGASARFREQLERIRATLAALIVEDLEEVGLARWPAECAARALTGALGEVLVWQVTERRPPEDLRAAGEEVRRLFWRGLGLAPPDTPAPGTADG